MAISKIHLVDELVEKIRESEWSVRGSEREEEEVDESKLVVANRRAMALLDEWMSEPDNLGQEWWDEFDNELRANRFSLRRG